MQIEIRNGKMRPVWKYALILLPPDILFEPVIEIESVYVDYYTLFIHKKISPP